MDEIISDLASQLDLKFDKTWVLRRRGNSAQQMGKYGREASRESIVFMAKDA